MERLRSEYSTNLKTCPDISRIFVARPWRRVCHRATAGGWIRGVLEHYVAGSDTRGRPEGRSYPRSEQAIREISGLAYHSFPAISNYPSLNSAHTLIPKSLSSFITKLSQPRFAFGFAGLGWLILPIRTSSPVSAAWARSPANRPTPTT
jgi:hypothetical protein